MKDGNESDMKDAIIRHYIMMAGLISLIRKDVSVDSLSNALFMELIRFARDVGIDMGNAIVNDSVLGPMLQKLEEVVNEYFGEHNDDDEADVTDVVVENHHIGIGGYL